MKWNRLALSQDGLEDVQGTDEEEFYNGWVKGLPGRVVIKLRRKKFLAEGGKKIWTLEKGGKSVAGQADETGSKGVSPRKAKESRKTQEEGTIGGAKAVIKCILGGKKS